MAKNGVSAQGWYFDDGSTAKPEWAEDVEWRAFPDELSGFFLPVGWRAFLDLVDVPYGVEMRLRLNQGRVVCSLLTLYETSIDLTSEGLRRVPVARLVKMAAVSALQRAPGAGGQRTTSPSLDEWDHLYRNPSTASSVPRGHLDDDHYQKVAEVYRAAAAAGLRPTRSVGERLHASSSTAARWVMEARKRGFLGLTSKGRSGEAMNESDLQDLAQRRHRRPGRAGHPPEFYRAIADRYSALRDEVPNPVGALRDELAGRGEHYSVNTVGTWVKRARSLGILPAN